MLKIRLQKTGRKGESTFRLVLTDSKNGPKSGGFKEILGSYNPQFDERNVKADRIKYWIENGAQVSDTVHNILVSEKVIDGKKINALPKKSPVIDEEALKAEAEAKEKAEADAKVATETPPEDEASTEESIPAEQEISEEEKKEESTDTPVEETPEEKKEEASE